MTEHCDHECVCNKYIDYTNTGATAGRACNGETWCFKQCPHDTQNRSAMMQQALANEKYFAINDTLITAIGEWDKEPHDIVRILSLLRACPLSEHDTAIAAKAREEVIDDAWEDFNKIERYDHIDSSDREYCGSERIIALTGADNSVFSVLNSLCSEVKKE